MELRSPLSAHASPRLTPPLRTSRRRLHRVVAKVASAEDFETDDEKDQNSPTASDEASRKKLEVVTGLLREGYGVGAILTAAAFRSAAFAGDLIKNFTQSSQTVRRQKALGRRVRSQKKSGLTQEMTSSLGNPGIEWKKPDQIDRQFLKAEMSAGDEVSHNEEFAAGSENPSKIENEESELEDSNLSFELPFLSETQSDAGDLEVRDESDDSQEMDFKKLLGVPQDEQISSRHISEDTLKPSSFIQVVDDSLVGSEILEGIQPEDDEQNAEEAQLQVTSEFVDSPEEEALTENVPMENAVTSEFVDSPEEEALTEDVPMENAVTSEFADSPEEDLLTVDLPVEDSENILEELMQEEPADVTEQEIPSESEEPAVTSEVEAPETRLENNVERFQSPEETPAESGEDSSVVMNRAMEILDEIASFELENGEPVDDEAEEEKAAVAVPTPNIVEMSKAESEAEIKRQMRAESEKRLKAMRVGNEPKYQQRESPVKVERPTPQSRERPAGTPMSPPTQKFKGLDYIKSYAKENHDRVPGEPSKESSNAFFKPPPILQDTKKSQVPQASSSPSRGYTQWNEVDRLQRVREIGTVLWLGRGGNGGNGGNGGGGGGGRPGDNSDDKGWWIQVGVSMMTMTALVFALLMAVSNQLEKQQKRKHVQEQAK